MAEVEGRSGGEEGVLGVQGGIRHCGLTWICIRNESRMKVL